MITETIKLKSNEQKLIKQAEDISTQVTAIKITNQIEYEQAGEHLKSVKADYKKLEELRLSMTRPIDESKRKIMELFRIPLDKLVNAESWLKKVMLIYQQTQERLRQEQERKLQEKAEKERQEALRKAEQAREQGKEANAEKLEEKANNIIAPVLAPTIEKVSGVTTKKIWKFEVIDENLIPHKYLIPDLAKIGKEIRACGDSIKISGIRIYSEEVISAGGRL